MKCGRVRKWVNPSLEGVFTDDPETSQSPDVLRLRELLGSRRGHMVVTRWSRGGDAVVTRWCSQRLSRGFGAWAARSLACAAWRRAQAAVLRWFSGKLAVAWGTWVDTYQRSPKLPLTPKQAIARWRRRILTRALRRL